MDVEQDGHKIMPRSYQDGDMPRYWFPLAVVETPTGDSVRVALPPARGIAKTEADTVAIREAKRRIASKNL